MAHFTPMLHQSWILKMWREELHTGPGWRFVLENTQTSKRHGFQTMESLFNFIKTIQEQEK